MAGSDQRAREDELRAVGQARAMAYVAALIRRHAGEHAVPDANAIRGVIVEELAEGTKAELFVFAECLAQLGAIHLYQLSGDNWAEAADAAGHLGTPEHSATFWEDAGD